ncbi:diguanylate cyclase [Kineococcus sp. T13]|uniref:diguanylate cyclase n=1 Tax=Kineococcus vitellinus TaxID=2696565 RepID=UPI00141221C8|nr:GGDEF domain-containing protein [Kineococcus vitellinus]NAZ76346.1 diguanylate cyclase [Kineococcus vitellinus]
MPAPVPPGGGGVLAAEVPAAPPFALGSFVVMVVDEITGYQRGILGGIEDELADTGTPVLVAVDHPRTGQDEDFLVRLLERGRVAALVVTAVQFKEIGRVLCSRAVALGLPVVTISRRLPGIVNVDADNATATRELMAHLLDECGVRRPALLRGVPDSPDSAVREEGFRRALAERGLEVDEDLVLEGSFRRELAHRAVTALLARRRDVDAVVATNDAMAHGAVDALRMAGLSVPGDVLVTGFDDVPAVRGPDLSLTTVDPRLDEQGRAAVRSLRAQAAGAGGTGDVRVPTTLVRRGSTRQAAAPGSVPVPAVGDVEAVARLDQDHLLEITRAFADCTSLEELVGELAAHVPRLGVRSCFLVLLQESPGGAPAARLALAYAGGAVSTEPVPFGHDELLPPGHLALLGGRAVMRTLATGACQHGYLLLEPGRGDRSRMLDLLQVDLTRALDALARERRLQQQAEELERVVALRTRQLEQEVAVRREAEAGLRRANAELERIALRDPLTGLANRRALDGALAGSWARAARAGEPLALAVCDVDHFKAYNDRYGHPAGDQCLRAVASALASVAVRPGDVSARHGGEEFAVLLPGTDEAGAAHVAGRLLAAVRALGLEHAGSAHATVSVSVGWSVLRPARGGRVEDLVDAADRALYRAKAAGRDRVAGPAEVHAPAR